MSWRSWSHRVVAAAATVVLVATGLVVLDAGLSAAVVRQAGDPDPGFGGGDGIVTQVAPSTFRPSEVLAIDPQGRLIVSGTSGGAAAQDSALNRFTAAGAPDPTFNGSPTGFSMDLSLQGVSDYPRGLAVLTTGEIVRAAEYQQGGLGGTNNTRLAVQKLGPDGEPGPIAVLGDGGIGGMAGALSGHVVALPGGKFLVSGSNPFNSRDFGRFFVVRFNNDLSVDATFDGDGVAFADRGVRAVNQAIAVQPDGKILLGGHIGDVGHDAGVVRLLAGGGLDLSFSGDGWQLWDASGNGANDWADGLAVEPGGGLIAVSGYSEGGPTGHVTVLQPDGAFDPAFGTAGVHRFFGPRVADVAWDSLGRIVVPLGNYGGTVVTGVARLVVAGSPMDTSFSGDGIATIPGCEGAYAVGVTSLDRPVITGVCGSSMLAVRFLGESSGWTGLSYSIDPVAPAGRDAIPLDDVTLQALAAVPEELQSTPLRGTPLRGTPLRGTPLRGTPLRGTPLRGTPLRGTPLRGTAMATTPLSTIPLVQDVPTDPTWSDVLQPTVYRDVPLTNVTLGQVLALPTTPTDPLAGITLADIPLRGTPLRGTSITSLLLGQIPLVELPAPAGGWCAFLADGQDATCTPQAGTSVPVVNPATWTLLDLELAGVDLSAYYALPLPLGNVDLVGSVLGDTLAADLDLPKTPFGALAPAAVPGLVTCPGCAATIGEAQLLGLSNLSTTMTLAAVIQAVVPEVLPDVTLGQVLRGLVRSEDLPIEDLPIGPLLDRAPARTPLALGVYTADLSYDLICSTGPSDEPDLTVTIPDGARYITGSQVMSDGEALYEADDIGAAVAAGSVSFDLPPICAGEGVHPLTLSFQLDPPVVLGPLGPSTATLENSTDVESVVADASTTVDARENSDDLEIGARLIQAATVYTGHLGTAGDVDLYRIPAPPAGSALSVSLSHLPADYDLSVYGQGDELASTPLRGTPLRGTPLRGTPVGDSLGDPAAPVTEAGAEGLADIPLRGTPLRGTSINRGTSTEGVSVLSKAADAPTGFLVQVSGFDGAHSDQPYVLRARVIAGPTAAPCPVRSFPNVGTAGAWPQSIAAETETLFLVNQQRLGARYGAAEAAAAIDRLRALAGRSDVRGVVLPVESAPGRTIQAKYAAWDAEPCSVAAANAVVTEINAAVDTLLRPQLANLRHVVLVGSDEVVPQARIPDLTRLSNQLDYTENVRYRDLDNPISRAFLEGNLLSDEPYGDFDPQPWLTGKLYVSDVGLGRLVETPAEIQAAADRFIAADGTLAPTTGYVTGYDFLSDGAEAVSTQVARLAASGVVKQINETWTAQDAAAGIAAHVGGLASVNAHYDHFEALPAAPFNAGSTAADQLLTTAELPASLLNTILFTMGCEAGLNVADVLVSDPSADEAASLRDWAQTVTSRGGVFAGNTGYGYGDTDAVAYSERIMANFAELLAGGQASVGQALMFAKQRYQAELGVAGVYDAKVMEEATFYGLPMYRIGATGVITSSAVPAFEPAPVTDDATPEPIDETVTFATPVVGDHGTHYEVVGEQPQVTHYRPIQPRLDREYDVTAAGRVHGVVIEDLVSRDLADVDPAYATPTVDLSAHEPEAGTRTSVFPAAIQSVSSMATPTGRKDVVVLMPGQFFAGDGRDGRGTQRLFDEIHGQILRSTSTDFVTPTIQSVDAVEEGAQARIAVVSAATDVVRAVGLYRIGTDTTVQPDWIKVELAPVAGGFTGAVPLPAGQKVVDLMIQLVDGAGNVGISSNKGPGYRSAPPVGTEAPVVSIDPPIVGGFVADEPVITVGTPGLFEVSVDGEAVEAPGGSFVVEGEGPHEVVVRDPNGGSTRLSFFTDSVDPAVVITAPAEGVSYLTGSVPAPAFACTDPAPASGVTDDDCTVAGYGTTAGTHTMTVTARDGAGNVGTASVTYEVVAPPPTYSFGGFFAPVENPEIVNKAKPGTAIPVKFQVFRDGVLVTDPTVVQIRSASMSCSSFATLDQIEETVSAGSSGLRYDATSERFVYTWKTDRSWTGCRKLIITVAGVEKVALFQLTR